MPHSKINTRPSARRSLKPGKHLAAQAEVRYTVGLAPGLANQVERYAKTVDTSRSKAIAALVRLGLEGQAIRKREFFKKLKANLDNDSPEREEQLVDEFRALILGR
jgi:hypothetical protein